MRLVLLFILAMSAARGISAGSYVKAGDAAWDNTIGTIRAARRNAPDYGDIASEGIKQRAATNVAGIKAESEVAQAGIRAEANVRKSKIQADRDKSIAKSKATVRKAGKIAAAGIMIGDGITEGKRAKARYELDQRQHAEKIALIKQGQKKDDADGVRDGINMETEISELLQDEPKPSGEVASVSGVTSSQPAISSSIVPLQKLIHDRESYGGNYGAFNLRGEDDGHTPIGSGIDNSLTSMTVQQVMNTGRHAQGGYQIIPSTLSGLMAGEYGDTGVKLTDKFDKTTQDKFFGALARNRVVPGNPQATMKGLRSEWVGLQNVDDSVLLPAVKQFMSGL